MTGWPPTQDIPVTLAVLQRVDFACGVAQTGVVNLVMEMQIRVPWFDSPWPKQTVKSKARSQTTQSNSF